MPELHAIILDDNEKDREITQNLLTKKFPKIKIEYVGSDLNEVVHLYKIKKQRILFADIKIQDVVIFDIYDKITLQNTAVIFLTKNSNYAIDAFKIDAVDYLLKPFHKNAFVLATNKAINKFIKQKSQKTMAIHSTSGMEVIEINRIKKVEARGNYTVFHFDNGNPLLASKTLKYFADILELNGFIRIHRSYYINMNQINRYNIIERILELHGGIEISVSRSRHSSILRHIKNS